MRSVRTDARAEITVFLALLLSTILSLILVLTEHVRVEVSKLKLELAMDEGLVSCFSEYSQKIYRRYDLLYIDTGYKNEMPDMERLKEHLAAYIAENIADNGGTDLLGLSLQDIELTGYLLGSDGEGGAMMNQAVLYMNEYGEVKYRSKIEDALLKLTLDNDENERFFREWDDYLAASYAHGGNDNIAQRIRNQSLNSSFLLLQGTSGALYRLNYPDVPSQRKLNAGSYPPDKFRTQADAGIFVEYLMQKLGCYTERVGEQALSCELEYLLFGNISDKENLRSVTDRLMSHREEVNLRLIMNSPDMLYETERLAEERLSEGEDVSALSGAIVYAWAYAESVIEVNRLLCGGRCNTEARRSSFILPLEDLESFTDYLGSDDGSGLTYKEYLGIMLNENPLRDNKRRFMDIVEMDMRKLENGNFAIDGLVEYVEAEGRFVNRYGRENNIRRAYAY